MKLLEKVFSIKNETSYSYKKYKIITILGIKFKFREKISTSDLEKEIKLLRTIIEKSIDITKLPKATGNLRKIQLIKAQLLKIMDIICKKHNLTYWIDFGTLIGAIRHKGFIPWDDDIDICMLREDYLKLPKIFEEELVNTELVFRYSWITGTQLIKLCYKGFPIDIFPMEYVNKRCETLKSKKDLKEKWLKVKDRLFTKEVLEGFKNNSINHFDIIPEADKLKKEIIDDDYCENTDTKQLIRSVETMVTTRICAVFETDYIFPLQEIEFEGFKFPAPSNPLQHLYESGEYGEYGAVMNFPTIMDAGFSHTQENYDSMSDLDEILIKLKEINL